MSADILKAEKKKLINKNPSQRTVKLCKIYCVVFYSQLHIFIHKTYLIQYSDTVLASCKCIFEKY